MGDGAKVTETPGIEPLDAVEARLLRRFAADGRLRREELDALAHILPADSAPYARTGTAKAYAQTFAEYGRRYNVIARTVKWWVQQGKRHPAGVQLPPLDSPESMPDWWARTMKQRCPDNILAAARAARGPEPEPEAAPATAPAAPPPPIVFQAGETTSGFELTLRQNRHQLALAYQELIEAQSATPRDPVAIEQARRRWMTLDAAVQKAEERAPDILEKTGRLIDRDTLAAELAPMVAAAGESIRSMLNRVRPRLRKAADESEEDAIWQAAVDDVFAELNRSGYTAPFHLLAA